jgi:hypothetical protein
MTSRPQRCGFIAILLASAASAAPSTATAPSAPASATAPASQPTLDVAALEPALTRFTLPNGLRVAILRHPRLQTLGVYTYLPGGWMADDAKRTMWSRLVERLVTQTDGFSTGVVAPGFTRTETRTWPDKLESALDEQLRVLLPMSFKDLLVRLYREDVIAEALHNEQIEQRSPIYASRDSFRAAEAAFAQAWRHRRSAMNLEEDIGDAATAEVQAYHDRYWTCRGGLLCVVGNVDPAQVETLVRKRFNWPMKPAPRQAVQISTANDIQITWDLTNRYVCTAWLTPERSPREQAALKVVQCLLERSWGRGMRGDIGILETRINVRAPDGLMIWLGVSLRPDASPESSREAIEERLGWLKRIEEKQLLRARSSAAAGLTMSAEPKAIREARLRGDEIQPFLREMAAEQQDLSRLVEEEEQFLREWCDLEWYYGESLPLIRAEAERIRSSDVARVVEKFLSPRNAITVMIAPRAAK